jgi:membrane protein YdbS with pleckstrin-like domain
MRGSPKGEGGGAGPAKAAPVAREGLPAPVALEARLHGAALARPLVRGLVVAAPATAVVVLGAPRAWPLGVVGALALALVAVGAVRAVLAWDRTTIVVTPDRLVVAHGVLRRRTATVTLAPGGALEVQQGLVGRLLGFGTVAAGELEIPYVADPRRLSRVDGMGRRRRASRRPPTFDEPRRPARAK